MGQLYEKLVGLNLLITTSYSATDYSQSYQPPPSLQTHPNLPKGKEQVTLLCQRLQQINSANEHQPPPSLPRWGGTVTIAVDKTLII